MSWLDRILGRSKKDEGEMMGGSSMPGQGMGQEREGMMDEPSMPEQGGMEGDEEAGEKREGM